MKILNTYHVPVPVRANAKDAGFLAVLTQGAGTDQAVYIGIVGDLNIDSPDYESARDDAADWIAYRGLKQTYRKALAYFPTLKESDYRA